CAVCGGAPEAPVVSLTELTVRCARCGAPAPGERPLSNEAFAALSHFVSAPLKRLLPPPAVPEPLAELTGVTESWADSRIGGRGSRNYYKGMLNYG
ncbi:MAG: hypothetical protein IJL69_06605, partial [Oscillospiraceae bacterium]|nr:hypothetical protein [Oscillospiraceae bacterium]